MIETNRKWWLNKLNNCQVLLCVLSCSISTLIHCLRHMFLASMVQEKNDPNFRDVKKNDEDKTPSYKDEWEKMSSAYASSKFQIPSLDLPLIFKCLWHRLVALMFTLKAEWSSHTKSIFCSMKYYLFHLIFSVICVTS